MDSCLSFNNIYLKQAFSPDIAVTLDNWVGMARTVKFKITLRTREGSLCSMDDQQAMELRQMNVKYSRVCN